MYSTYEFPSRENSPTRRRSPTARKSSSSVAARTASARASSSTIAAAACFALAEAGYRSIMINCNPETVSTDYDIRPPLFRAADGRRRTCWRSCAPRRPAAAGRRHRPVRRPDPAKTRRRAGEGRHTDPRHLADSIDLAEDRDRFQKLLHKLDLTQPRNGIAWSVEQARGRRRTRLPAGRAPPMCSAAAPCRSSTTRACCNPTCSTPSRPRAGGHQAEIPTNDKTGQINTLLGKNPLLFDTYLEGAIEVDVDCLSDGAPPSSPASWSTSRRPASIPATAPARCWSTRCPARSSTSWSARPPLSPRPCMSAA